MGSKRQPGVAVGFLNFQHPISCLRSSPGLGHHEYQRLSQLTFEFIQDAIDPVRICVVDEER